MQARTFSIEQIASFSPLIKGREEAINEIAHSTLKDVFSGHLKFLGVKNFNVILELRRLNPGAKTLEFVFKMLAHLIDDHGQSSNRKFDGTMFIMDGIIDYLKNLEEIDQSLIFDSVSALPSSNFAIEAYIL